MANAIYPKWKEALIQGSANTSLTGTVKAVFLDTADEAYSAADTFLSDVTGAGIVGTAQTLANKTFVNGTLDADDVTFTAVSGDQSEAILIYIDTGVGATSRLVAFLDTGYTGLPVTPSGGNITITWAAGGIFTI
jgi:selenophosphate synthase